MADATNVQLRDFKNGSERLSWVDLGAVYMLMAGKGDSIYYVTEIKFTLSLPASAISVVLRSGATAYANNGYPLHYKLMTAESSDYANARTNDYDGTVGWSGSGSNAAINISGSYAAGTYYLYLFSGTTIYGNYTEIWSNYSTAVTYTAVSTYALTATAGTGSTITINRTASAYGNTGTLASGATLYPQDKLQITFTAQSTYEIDTHTVNGSPFTSGSIHTVSAAVSVVATAKRQGLIYLGTGSAMVPCQCYLDTGTEMVLCLPYLGTGTEWALLA